VWFESSSLGSPGSQQQDGEQTYEDATYEMLLKDIPGSVHMRSSCIVVDR
jgi:hypothetical protein